MADLNKFEEMLERLVNEDKAGAEELFHEIVVEKSRDIYESLLEDEEVDETTDEEVDEASDEEVDEATDEEVDESDDEDLDENFDLDEFEVEADDEADPMADMGGDMGDDMAADMGDEMGDEEGEGDVEDRVEDLEDALDELKAEFEKMMSGDDGEEGDDMDMDADDAEMDDEADEAYAFEATDEEVDEAADEEVDEADKSEAETMREYVEKVSATMGDNGANTKSAVAGKNDMGGTAGNLNQAGAEAGVEANKGNLKGSALSDQNPKDMATGNVNVPGGKASKSMKAQPKGHGAEKKQSGGETGTNGTKSVIGQ
jgi:hypothetical protein